MVKILLVSKRQEAIKGFIDALYAVDDVDLDVTASATDVLDQVRRQPPSLVIVDYHLEDMAPLDLAMELLKINALVNIAVVSTMNEDDFHEATEGLGLLPRIPSPPAAMDVTPLLDRLREVLVT